VTRTLVVSAFGPEIAPLRRLVRGGRGLVTATVGIGAVDAAVGAARAIATARAQRVIFVGTAGVYAHARPSLAIGSAAVAGEIHAVSTAVLRAEGYLPSLVVVRAETSTELRAALSTGPGGPAAAIASVACPSAITRSARLGREMAASTGAALENLEAFAVGRAAAAAGLPFAAVLGVANRVGPGGHRQWLEHHQTASRAACRLIARFLAGGR
jgi:nucleoside phosphorylase